MSNRAILLVTLMLTPLCSLATDRSATEPAFYREYSTDTAIEHYVDKILASSDLKMAVTHGILILICATLMWLSRQYHQQP